jgi:hypothetical protein
LVFIRPYTYNTQARLARFSHASALRAAEGRGIQPAQHGIALQKFICSRPEASDKKARQTAPSEAGGNFFRKDTFFSKYTNLSNLTLPIRHTVDGTDA